ncbi:hypothetical protein D3C81_1877230 [compost metagenome]
MGLAVFQGNAFRGDQQRGVVEATVVVLGHTDHHGDVVFTRGGQHGADGRAVERFGGLRHGFGRREAHQVGFREHDQLRVGRTRGNRCQCAFEVVGRGIVTACQLREFDFHGNSL